MRTVSIDEAKRTLDNMTEWAKRPIEKPKGGEMGGWIYNSHGFIPQMEIMKEMMQHVRQKRIPLRMTGYNQAPEEMARNIIAAKSPTCAVQKDWRTPTDFPLCPTDYSDNGLLDYYANLSMGKVLTENIYGGTVILEYAINTEQTHIWVLCKRTEKYPIKPWVLTGIYIDNGKFVHENLHSFFEEKGGYKYFTLAQGKEWLGGDCEDDYC